MEDVVETGWLSCPACDHTEYSEEILYKMYKAEGEKSTSYGRRSGGMHM